MGFNIEIDLQGQLRMMVITFAKQKTVWLQTLSINTSKSSYAGALSKINVQTDNIGEKTLGTCYYLCL